MSDLINSPQHYNKHRWEAIEIIEDVVKDSPDPVTGHLVGCALKYLLRCWYKDDPKMDLAKATWYLNRAVARLSDAD